MHLELYRSEEMALELPESAAVLVFAFVLIALLLLSSRRPGIPELDPRAPASFLDIILDSIYVFNE